MNDVIVLPAGINGINEVGIAAGVDTFTQAGFQLSVVTVPTAGAPSPLTALEVRVKAVVAAYNSAPGKTEMKEYVTDDALVVGGSRFTAANIRDMIPSFPGTVSQVKAGVHLAIPDIEAKDNLFTTWSTTDVTERDFVGIDVDASLKASRNPCTGSITKKLWQGLAALVLSNGWLVKRSVACDNLVTVYAPEAPPAAIVPGSEINTIGFHAPDACATLVVALKVTWWLTNHHVGQREDELVGFIGKVAQIQGLWSNATPAQRREIRNVLWSFGKMTTTRGILSALGVDHIVYNDSTNTSDPSGNDYAWCGVLSISPSEDVLQRILAYPAGTASCTTYLSIANICRHSVFACCMPPFTSMGWDPVLEVPNGRAITDEQAILANRAGHHMGAHFLTGTPRLIKNSWETEEKFNLSAFIHAVQPNGSLAKAAVIVAKSEIVGGAIHTTISSMKLRMQTSMGDTMSALLVSRMGGGVIGGGVGLQFGKLTNEEVAAVADQVEEYERGPVSDDEDTDGTRGPIKTEMMVRNRERATRRAARALITQAIGNP